MPRFLTILFFVFLNTTSFSQKPFTTLDVPGEVDNIQGMMVGNDIFLTMEESNANGAPSSLSYFIKPDGTHVEIDLNRAGMGPLIAGVRQHDSTYFYYLDINKDHAYINSLLANQSGPKTITVDDNIEVPGKIYGSYVENERLYILCAVKKDYTIKLLGFHSGRLESEKTYPLSFDLGKRKESIVSFFETKYVPTPRQASGLVKLIKEKEFLWILADEPPTSASTENTGFKTTVIRINLVTSESVIKTFFEEDPNTFVTYLQKGQLFRLVNAPRAARIDEYNFDTGKKVKTTILNRGKEPGRDSTYARIGGRFRTEKDVKGAYIVKRVFGSLLIVDSLSQNEQLLTVGHYGDHLMKFGGVTNLLSVAVGVASLIVNELAEGPITTVYSYYRGSMDSGFTATYQSPFIQKVIDDYEYKQLIGRVRYEYRGYLNQPGFVYAVYRKAKSGSIEILKFEKHCCPDK